MIAGIYKLTSPSGSVYVGQSLNLKKRLGEYRRLDCIGQPKIFNAISKYGWKNINVTILWQTKNIERYRNIKITLDAIEKYAIKKYDCVANGYNSREGGTNGYTHSDETIRMISESNMIEVNQYSLDGNFIKTWPSATTIFDVLGISIPHINTICNGHNQRKTAGGYMWRFASYGMDNIKPFKCNRGSNRLKINQYSLEGQFIKTWESMANVENKTGIPNSKVAMACMGKRLSTGGYQWRYYKGNTDNISIVEQYTNRGESKRVNQYTKSGDFIRTYNSLSDAAKHIGVCRPAISNALSGKNKTSGGFKWSYYE